MKWEMISGKSNLHHFKVRSLNCYAILPGLHMRTDIDGQLRGKSNGQLVMKFAFKEVALCARRCSVGQERECTFTYMLDDQSTRVEFEFWANGIGIRIKDLNRNQARPKETLSGTASGESAARDSVICIVDLKLKNKLNILTPIPRLKWQRKRRRFDRQE